MEILLRKVTIKEFDVGASKEEVDKILTEYIRVKYAYSNIKFEGQQYYNSSTSAKYEYHPEIPTINYGDRIGNKACFKVYNEMEAVRIKKDIDNLYPKFTDQEKDYFDYVLLGKQPQRIVEDKYRITKSGLEPIRQSCIIKSALHFNVAVRYKDIDM